MSAQPKPISEVVKDFEQSLENLRPRVYMAGARAAIKAAGLELWQCPSATELFIAPHANLNLNTVHSISYVSSSGVHPRALGDKRFFELATRYHALSILEDTEFAPPQSVN